MKYNKFKEFEKNKTNDKDKKLIKNSSWESLKTLKNAIKTLVKSNSQISLPQKEMLNSQSTQIDILRKNTSQRDLKLSNINVSIDKKSPKTKTTYRECNNYETNTIYSSDNCNYRAKWENIKELYDKQILEIEKINKLNKKKDNKIKELEHNLSELIKYNTKLEKSKLLEGKNDKMNEFFSSFGIQMKIKNKEIADLKSENVLLRKRNTMSDEELEKKYINRLENEKNNFELQIKKILLEKQIKFDEQNKEINILKDQLKNYKNNYISRLEHEFILKKLKDELQHIIDKNKMLENEKNIVHKNEMNNLFTLQSPHFDNTILESKINNQTELLGDKSICFEMSSFSKSFRKQKMSEKEDPEDSINEEFFNISCVKLVKPNFKHH